MKFKLRFLFISFLTFGLQFGYCQNNPEQDQRLARIQQDLEQLSVSDPDLIAPIDISTKSIPIQDYVRLLAKTSGVNISIDPNLEYEVAAHFSDEEPINIIMHLVKRFDLDANITGSIIYLFQADPNQGNQVKKDFFVSYNAYNDALSYELNDDTLQQVVKAITELSKKNVVLQQGLRDQLVSGYVKEMPFDDAIGNFAYSNGLMSEQMSDGAFVLMLPPQSQNFQDFQDPNQPFNANNSLPPYSPRTLGVTFNYQLGNNDKGEQLISIEATKTPILDLIKPIADELGVDYVFLTDLQGEATIKAEGLYLDQYLTRILDATNYSFTKKGKLYIFSERRNALVNDLVLYQFKERSADSIIQFLPNTLKSQFVQGNQIGNQLQPGITNIPSGYGTIELMPVLEYNSILVSGPTNGVSDVVYLFEQLDRRVPLVLFELIVIDVKKGNSVGAGMNSLGIGTDATQTQGDLFNGGFTLGANTINSLLEVIEGFGSINLGRVGANFFTGLVALENNENIKIRNSTKLSTLNSHVAEFTFGQKEYYVNEQVTSTPSINGVQIIENKQYQSIEANTTLKIRPVVSGDHSVTLYVNFEESKFDLAGRIDSQAPPPTDNRKFTSLIRVQDQDMIVLGGIEREEKSDSGEGVPFLARIPIIKWFFSNHNKTKSKQKQLVFIRPTIVY